MSRAKTPQEIFDRSAGGMMAQGGKAMHPSGSCAYYDPRTGNRCAIGLLFTCDEIEEAGIEGMGSVGGNKLLHVLLLNKGYLEEAPHCSLGSTSSFRNDTDSERFHLLSELQSIHDRYYPRDWAAELTQLADKYSLSAAVVAEQA